MASSAAAAAGAESLVVGADAPGRFRRCESILRLRTERVAVVIETAVDEQNEQAALRSAEALGFQSAYIIKPPPETALNVDGRRQRKGVNWAIAKAAARFMTLHWFENIPDCIQQLRADGYDIWATDLAPGAEMLATEEIVRPLHELATAGAAASGAEPERWPVCGPLPKKVAIVFGRESDGVSETMLQAANKRVFLPMYGFTESYNLSVAVSLVLQRLIDLCPEMIGDMSWQTMREVRRAFYDRLGTTIAKQDQQLRYVKAIEDAEDAALAALPKGAAQADQDAAARTAAAAIVPPQRELRRGEAKHQYTAKLRKKNEAFDQRVGRTVKAAEALGLVLPAATGEAAALAAAPTEGAGKDTGVADAPAGKRPRPDDA